MVASAHLPPQSPAVRGFPGFQARWSELEILAVWGGRVQVNTYCASGFRCVSLFSGQNKPAGGVGTLRLRVLYLI